MRRFKILLKIKVNLNIKIDFKFNEYLFQFKLYEILIFN